MRNTENPTKKTRTYYNLSLECVTWKMKDGSDLIAAAYYSGADLMAITYGETEEQAIKKLDDMIDELLKKAALQKGINDKK